MAVKSGEQNNLEQRAVLTEEEESKEQGWRQKRAEKKTDKKTEQKTGLLT